MAIAIVGYGRMGQEIEATANEQGVKINAIFDVKNRLTTESDFNFATAIEFTEPSAVLDNIKLLAEKGKNIVTGTTGWYGNIDEVKEIVKQNNIGFVWGSNFSVGVNLFFKLVEKASSIFDSFEDFDVMLHEMHHKRKLDSPSGTALKLATLITENIHRKSNIVTDKIDREIQSDELHVSSTRGGEIFGKHSIYFDSVSDEIILSHNAKNRKGFAKGAVLSSQWIFNRKGFYEFREVIEDIVQL
jgi:4-hydroxy-tetrahydrodipicolinate reductase